MNRDDQWEKLWHSIPITAMPVQPVGLQSAVGVVIEKQSGGGSTRKRPQAISCRGEFANMFCGGSKLRVDLEEKAKLATNKGIQSAARDCATSLQRNMEQSRLSGRPGMMFARLMAFNWRQNAS
jgi:hypothetical protein